MTALDASADARLGAFRQVGILSWLELLTGKLTPS